MQGISWEWRQSKISSAELWDPVGPVPGIRESLRELEELNKIFSENYDERVKMSGTLGAWEDGNHGDGTPIDSKEDLPKVILDIDRDVDKIGDNQHREDIGNVRRVRDAVNSDHERAGKDMEPGDESMAVRTAHGLGNDYKTSEDHCRECLKWINQSGLLLYF
jgi:hypothetical protein